MAKIQNNNTDLTTEEIHKELELIQDVIKRMAENSFKVKSWFLGAMGAIAAFGFEKEKLEFLTGNIKIAIVFAALIIGIIYLFWWLDAFYLHTERLYRRLYAWVIHNRKYSEENLYDLNTFQRYTFSEDGKKGNVNLATETIREVMQRDTLKWMYLPMIFLALGSLIWGVAEVVLR